MAAVLAVENPSLGKRELTQYAEARTAPEELDRTKALARYEEMRAKIVAPETGKVEDETVAAMSRNSALMLKSFVDMKDQILPTAKAADTLNQSLKEIVATIKTMPEKKNRDIRKIIPRTIWWSPKQPSPGPSQEDLQQAFIKSINPNGSGQMRTMLFTNLVSLVLTFARWAMRDTIRTENSKDITSTSIRRHSRS